MGKLSNIIIAINMAFLTWYLVVILLKKIHIDIIEKNLFWLSHFSIFGWIFFLSLVVVYYKLIV